MCKVVKAVGQLKHTSMYTPLTYAQHSSTKELVFITTIVNFPSIIKIRPWAMHVEGFLKALDLKPTSCGGRGITWLELYILYRASGNPKPIANPVNVGFAKPTLHQQMVAFKCTVRSIVKRTLDSGACEELFKPYAAHEQQFKGLAIEGVHAVVSFNVALSQHAQNYLATQLIKLSRRCSSNAIESFLSGEVGFKFTKLNIKGKAGWDDSICASNAVVSFKQDVHELTDLPLVLHSDTRVPWPSFYAQIAMPKMCQAMPSSSRPNLISGLNATNVA